MSDFLNELNEAQVKAVVSLEGPVMVIAGAGSGKTRVLTYRIANMVKSGIDPFNILSLTFTNKAADEMKARIIKILGSNEGKNVWMGTFHSVFSRILRIESDKIGYTRDFSIYDTDEGKNLIKSIIKELDLDIKVYKPSSVLSRISMAKNNLISPEDYSQNNEIIQADASAQRPLIHELYKTYNLRLKRANAMDFDDLLFNTNVLFRDFPATLHKYQQIFKYILVDEYQDTNYAQYLILKKLAANNENICVVGDDAQSIYAFRGANIQNILNFKSDYPDYQLFKLEQNYRSTKNIVAAANSLIKVNQKQISKNIWTSNESGMKVKVIKASSESDEAKKIAEIILREKNLLNLNFSDFSILYRTNAQSRAFEEAFRLKNIPHKIYGGMSFYKRKEIKDVLSYFRLIFNFHDEEALKRIINYPQRGIGQTTMEKIIVHASNLNVPIWNIIANPRKYELPMNNAYLVKLEDFANKIMSFKAQNDTLNAYDLAHLIVTSTGIISELSENKDEPERYKNVEELLNAIRNFVDTEPEPDFETGEINTSFRSLNDFLNQVSLLSDVEEKDDDNADKTLLMTIHSAKGLEFPVVFIVGAEENLFPSFMSLNSRTELEEERRLFYVALTRAEKKAYITYAQTRYQWGQITFAEPSRFIDDIDDSFVEFEDEEFASIKPFKIIEQPKTKFNNSFSNKISNKIVTSSVPSKLKKLTNESIQNSPESEFATIDVTSNTNVEHEKFGFGKVIEIIGTDDNKKASVLFESGETKTLLLKFAKLRIV